MRTASFLGVAVLAVASLVFLPGCPKPPTIVDAPQEDFERPLPPGMMGLQIVDPRNVPDFTAACTDLKGMREALQYSQEYMAKPSSKAAYAKYGPTFTHERAAASLNAFAALLDSNPSPAHLNAAIREKFDCYTSVGWNGRGEVLFTGYYTPIFEASQVRTEKFKYPIYRQPPDVQKNPDGTIMGTYPTRQELETNEAPRLAGLELYWLSDPFEVYIVHVQGSAKLRLPDGRIIGVGYAASNGHDYKSIGKLMIADGKLKKGHLSLRGMIDYFKAHPQDVGYYTRQNPRFVFFAESQGEPRGSLNVPVTAWRSVATDKSIFPRASVVFVAAGMPRRGGNIISIDPSYTGFALDQDTGAAIRAPGRCDMYMGAGDEAGEMAGRMQEKGRLYYLLLKPNLVQQPAPATMPAPIAE